MVAEDSKQAKKIIIIPKYIGIILLVVFGESRSCACVNVFSVLCTNKVLLIGCETAHCSLLPQTCDDKNNKVHVTLTVCQKKNNL